MILKQKKNYIYTHSSTILEGVIKEFWSFGATFCVDISGVVDIELEKYMKKFNYLNIDICFVLSSALNPQNSFTDHSNTQITCIGKLFMPRNMDYGLLRYPRTMLTF